MADADADLFEGVPDVVAPTAGVDEPVVDADEEAARAAAREAQRKFEEEQDAQALEEEEAEMAEMEAEDAGQYSGKRKIIKHTLPPDMIVGVDPTSAEELAKRAARAAKFMSDTPVEDGAGTPAAAPAADAMGMEEEPAAPLILSPEEVAARAERAAKFGVEVKNPADLVVAAAPKNALWEKRRDAAVGEVERPEAVHIFGTDKMGTADLFRLFMGKGPEEPTHVEWVNDSSANVVFASGEGAAAALAASTVALDPTRPGIDAHSWRTPPAIIGSAGGVQLLLRVATTEDVKPAKRGASRWYGEVSGKAARAGQKGREGRRDAARRGELARKPPKGGAKRAPVGEVDSLDALMGMAPTLAEMAASKQTLGERMSQAPPSTFGGFDNLKDDLRSRLGKKVEL